MIATRCVPFGRMSLIIALVAGCDGGSGRRGAGDAAAIADARDAGDHPANSIGDAIPDLASATDSSDVADATSDDLAISDAGQDIGSDLQGDVTTTDGVSDIGAGGGGTGGGGSSGQGGTGGSASGGNGGGASGGSASGGNGGSGASGGTGAAAASLYLVTASNATQPSVLVATDLSLIDTVRGRAVRQVTLLGTTAIAYRGGALLTAQASGYTRITVLDPDTLAIVRVQTLAWDPRPAVFSADGRYMYAAHGDGYVAQVRVSDGMVTAEIRIPPPPGGMDPSEIAGLAIDPTESFLGLTSVHAGTGSSVALVRVSGQTLTLAYNWLSQPFPSSNCARSAEYLAFDRATTRLVVSDRNCTAFDVYSVTTGLFDPTASVMFERDGGNSPYSTTVVDERGQIWATNFDSIYRASISDPTRQKKIPFGPDPGGLSIDSTGRIVYALQNDPRANGIFLVDAETGTLTRQAWNLDLVPFGSVVATSALVDRAPPAQ